MLLWLLLVIVVYTQALSDCAYSLISKPINETFALVQLQFSGEIENGPIPSFIPSSNSSVYVFKQLVCGCRGDAFQEICQALVLSSSPAPTFSIGTRAPSTRKPTRHPSRRPTKYPTSRRPTSYPTRRPKSKAPTKLPTSNPSKKEYEYEVEYETNLPSVSPSISTLKPTSTNVPTSLPTSAPNSVVPSMNPTTKPSVTPTTRPSNNPHSQNPTKNPTVIPSNSPVTKKPTNQPSKNPIQSRPTVSPIRPTKSPTKSTSSPFSPVPTKSPVNVFEIDMIYTIPSVGSAEIVGKYRDQIQQAADKWSRVFLTDYSTSFDVYAGSPGCGGYVVNIVSTVHVENILMLVAMRTIDGPGNVIGQAGICAYDASGKPRIGIIFFDSADIDKLYNDGRLYYVTLHEMGHVFGIGTMWSSRGLVSGSFLYQGAYGNQGNLIVGGTGQARVEDTGGAGTARAHWKESVYIEELMTGWSEGPGVKMPLSIMTLMALQDLGHEVDLTQAEPYQVSFGRRLREKLEERDLSSIHKGCVLLNMTKTEVVQTKIKKHWRKRG